jgi:cyclic pyranopterin phosphate synthase
MTQPSVAVRIGRTRGLAPVSPGAASGALVDGFGRMHRDLRISVTDRCNLRCTYCMPEGGVAFAPSEDLLSFDEIERVARAARSSGITRIRLTGGEPLLRPRLPELVGRLAALELEDLALTTNGMTLARSVSKLVSAGLQRVNISCDSLKPDRFAAIRRQGDLGVVLRAMDAAEAAGLPPVKVNVVLIAGKNDDEILDFVEFGRRTGRLVRFIEFMPLDAEGAWRRDDVVSGQQVLEAIADRWPLTAVADGSATEAAPAERFAFDDGGGEVGIIRSVTAPFCATCDRLRLTADGSIRNCLFSDEEISIRSMLRRGCSDAELVAALGRSVGEKRAAHGIDGPGFTPPLRSMSMIGG